MSPLLTVLNESWVIKCAAMDHMGEAKSELGIMSKKLLADPAYAISDKENVATELVGARKAYVSGDARLGAHKLMVVSRRLWVTVVAEHSA